ncbi:MAG: hypothetical protein ACXWLH_04575, partial [Candidatus Saccharimonadales bacterium]
PDLAPRLSGPTQDEKDLLNQVRAQKAEDERMRREAKLSSLGVSINENGEVSVEGSGYRPPEVARHAGELAMEHVTGEHNVVSITAAPSAVEQQPTAEATSAAEVRQQAL